MSKQLTKNFNSKEFNCKDGTEVPAGLMYNLQKLAENLQRIRYGLGERPITINSGYRTNSYNQKVGGAQGSYHLRAMAADITVKGLKPIQVWEGILAMMRIGLIEKGGVILYDKFVHYDIRGHEMAIKD